FAPRLRQPRAERFERLQEVRISSAFPALRWRDSAALSPRAGRAPRRAAALPPSRARHKDEDSSGAAKEILASRSIAFMYPLRDAIRTCLWPIVVMQRRSASFLAEPVIVGRSREGGRYGCNPTQGRSALD